VILTNNLLPKTKPMKKLFFLVVIMAVLAACSQKPKYTITGSLEEIASGQILLEQRVGNDMVIIDSSEITDGSFTLNGSVAIPDLYHMRIPERRGRLTLFVENSEITISGHADSLYLAKVSGSAVQDELEVFNTEMDQLNDMIRSLSGEYRTANQDGDEEKMAELEKKYEELDAQMTSMQEEYISSHPASYISPYIIRSISFGKEADEMEELLAGLDEILAESLILKELWKRVEVLKSVAIGQIAPDFTMNDTKGVPVALSSLRGNVLLVDFWAAWCGPCRRENPNVVEAYNRFHDKGFDILGVSLDDNKEDWLQAIEDDLLTWNHVSDLQGWSNAAAAQYGIQGIPANVLLDKEGKIIDKDLRGEDLQTRLAELLD